MQDKQVFAGAGTRTPLHEGVAEGLSKQYKSKTSDWKHVKAIAVLDVKGEPVKAELHWFEEGSVGKVKGKVKKWPE